MPTDNQVKQEKSAGSGNEPEAAARPCPPDKPIVTESSWGDKWKRASFGTTFNFGVNYVINTLSSVAIAYAFERKFKSSLRHSAAYVGVKVSDMTGGHAIRSARNFYSGTKGITLTMGGTMLVPVLKVAEDHRQQIEFGMGHALDVVQDKLGLGNTATEENLREYKVIKHAVNTGKAPDVCDDDMERFKTQHHVDVQKNGKYGFTEHTISWPKIIAARAAAWGAAFITNTGLEDTVGLSKRLGKAAPDISSALTKKFPVYGKLSNPDSFSVNLMNDAILTVSSSVTQAVVGGALNKEKRVPIKHIQPKAPIQPQSSPLDMAPDASAEQPKQWAQNLSQAAEGHVARVEQGKAAANDDLHAVRA